MDDDDSVDTVNGWEAERLENYCSRKDFSVKGLNTHLQNISQRQNAKGAIQYAKMLWDCSEHISVEMVNILLEYHPEIASINFKERWGFPSYALHRACKNVHCPHDVILLLLDKNPAALRHSCVIGDGVDMTGVVGFEHRRTGEVSGLPLHYYLSRPSDCIDIEIVLKLVKTYPESITIACEDTLARPIDILLSRMNFPEFKAYCTTKPITVDGLRERINNIPQELYKHVHEHFNLLNMVCSNENVTLEVVKYLLEEYDTEGASKDFETHYWYRALCEGQKTTAYPLHYACKNKSCPNSVVQLLMERCPSALSHVSVVDNGVMQPEDDCFTAGLPLHYYLSREDNIDLETVKWMVGQYPESLTTDESGHGLYFAAVASPLYILLNSSISNSYEVIQFLIETNNGAVLRGRHGYSSLRAACTVKEIDPRVIGLILGLCDQSFNDIDDESNSPIHILCQNESVSDKTAEAVLAILVENNAFWLRRENDDSELPIHIAAAIGKSPLFIRILVDGYKESILCRLIYGNELPLHMASHNGHLATAKCLFDLDPSTLVTRHGSVGYFFRSLTMEKERNAVVKAKNVDSLLVRDEVGQVPLHHALYDNHASLGSIKMLLEASPDSLFIADNDGTMPLHVACGFSTADIVEYLIDYFTTSFGEDRRPNIIRKKDKWGNTPLHYACRGAKCDTVRALLGKQEHIAFVSKRNDDEKLPIHLLCDARKLGLPNKVDTESIEYTEALWLLLRHCPETIVNW